MSRVTATERCGGACLQLPLSAVDLGAPTAKRVTALYWYGKDFMGNVDFDRGSTKAYEGNRSRIPFRIPGAEPVSGSS
jgi:hypothetical protein